MFLLPTRKPPRAFLQTANDIELENGGEKTFTSETWCMTASQSEVESARCWKLQCSPSAAPVPAPHRAPRGLNRSKTFGNLIYSIGNAKPFSPLSSHLKENNPNWHRVMLVTVYHRVWCMIASEASSVMYSLCKNFIRQAKCFTATKNSKKKNVQVRSIFLPTEIKVLMPTFSHKTLQSHSRGKLVF